MRQFDLFRNPSLESREVAPFLVMMSSHHLRDLSEIVVAPLVNDAAETVGDRFSVAAKGLKSPVGNLTVHQDAIRRAIERLFSGF